MAHLADEALAALEAGDPEALIEFHRRTFGGFVMEHEEDQDDPDDGDESEDEESEDDDTDDSDDDDGEDADDEDEDEPLGEKGRKALDRMKGTVKDLKRTIRDLKTELDEARNGSDEEDDELTSARKATETERTKRIEAEKKLAAKIHGLPDSWADRLRGDDLDDFLDDAEALAEEMPATPRNRKGGGGAKDGRRKRKEPSLDDKIAEAEKNGDLAEARRLKAQKVHQLRQAAG
jgi:hypothetical protein